MLIFNALNDALGALEILCNIKKNPGVQTVIKTLFTKINIIISREEEKICI